MTGFSKLFPHLSVSQDRAIGEFSRLLYSENAKQNLTRIQGRDDFIDGHLMDVLELFKTNWLGNSVLDIGSGSGVPGLLAAAIDDKPERNWILVDSEASKAEYLEKSALTMSLRNVSVYGDRVESAIKALSPDTVIARAVGNVEKIGGWILNCSTWNNLILFKSRGWEEEWKSARNTKIGKKLTVTQTHEYSIKEKYRVLVLLSRR